MTSFYSWDEFKRRWRFHWEDRRDVRHYEWPVAITLYRVKHNMLRSAFLTIVQHELTALPHGKDMTECSPGGITLCKTYPSTQSIVTTVRGKHCVWWRTRAVQVRAREGDTSLRGKPDTARLTPRTFCGLSSPRGPAHYPRLPNYHLMCPDMTNVVDNRWTMRSQPFNTATKWWTGLCPTPPRGRAASLGDPGSGSTLTLPSMCSFLTPRHAPLVIHASPRTHILRVVIIRRVEKIPTWTCNWVFTAAGS